MGPGSNGPGCHTGRPATADFAQELALNATTRLPPLTLGLGESPRLQQLPDLHPQHFGDSFNRRQPYAFPSLGLNVLKVSRGQPRSLSGRFLTPPPCQPHAADVGAENVPAFTPLT